MATGAPYLQDVLANVCRGRVAYIVLDSKQKRALCDGDGQIALDVLRHLLGTRPMRPERFPLTEQVFQAVARRLGYVVGQKRCRVMVKRLRAVGVICGIRAIPAALPKLPHPLGLLCAAIQAGQEAPGSPAL